MASVLIPSYGRQESLEACLRSLNEQTVKPFEIIIEGKKGPLSEIRNQIASRSSGDILCFIDDDVECNANWLASILHTFRGDGRIAGVSGPSVIRQAYRQNRDFFRFRTLRKIHDFMFLGRQRNMPGHITKAGAWTPGATEETCTYEGEVQFLEACNMSFRKEAFEEVGGFDENYLGIGDWSEPDLAFRVRRAGHKLWFARDALVYHNPSRGGAFRKRAGDSHNRPANYERFSRAWVKPCFRHSLYKLFLKSYYAIKALE